MPLTLQSPRWEPRVKHRLQSALQSWSQSDERLAAVFDFDNTCVFHDVGDVIFRAQMARFDFRLSPEAFEAHLPKRPCGVDVLADGTSIPKLCAAVALAYRQLHAALVAPNDDDATRNEALISLATEVASFRVLLGALYTGIESSPDIGARFAYPWVCGLMAGFSDDEIGNLAVSAWSEEVARPLAIVTERCERQDGLPTTFEFRSGVRALPEISALFAALAEANVERFIVTASEQQVVRALAPRLGLAIAPENIFGMRLERDDAGRRRTTLSHTPTYREGKQQTIDERIIVPHQRRIVLAAGDSDNDYEMLTTFDGCLRLIFHRTDEGDISRLYADDDTLVQGRSESGGHFIPASRSTWLEATQEISVPRGPS